MNKNTLYFSFYRRIGLSYELKNRWATWGISSINKFQKIPNIKTLPAIINVHLKNYLCISKKTHGDIVCQFEIKLNKPIEQFRCLVLDCDILLWFDHNFISVKYFEYKNKIFAIEVFENKINLCTYKNFGSKLTQIEQIPTQILKLC